MNFSFDFYNRVEKPVLILQNATGENIGSLGFAFEIKMNLKYNDISTLSFNYPKRVDGKDCPYFDELKGNKIIYIPNVGKFKLFKPKYTNDGITEIKECNCYSLEYELNQRKITSFSGTYQLYNPTSPEESILGILIDNYLPSWSIGEIDLSVTSYRTFDINSSTIYSFLNTDCEKAFEVIFTFDTFNRKINFKSVYNLSSDSGVFLSFDNLLNNVEVEENTDQIITKLYVYGSSSSSTDMSINGVNPTGNAYICDYSYFMTTEWVSQGLIDAYTNYKALYDNLQPTYANYLTALKNAKASLLEAETALTDLQSVLDSHVNIMTARIQASQTYADITTQIVAQNSLITAKKNEITSLNNTITSLNSNLDNINSQLKFENYFTESQLLELDSITFEDTYQTSDFILTSSMSNVEVQQQEQDLMDYGERLLARVSKPRYSFKVDSTNFLFLKEFSQFSKDIALGKYLTVHLRDDGSYTIQPILLEIELDFDDETSFSLTFGNRTRLDSSEFYLNDILNTAITSGTSVSFDKYTYSDWSTSKDDVTSFINAALDCSKNAVISSSKQSVLIDEHGIWCRQLLDNGSFDSKQIRIIGSNIVLSQDGFNTATIGIGLIKDDRYGSIYGIAAPLLCGRMIVGNNLRIENSANQFTLDESGCTLNNASFTLTANNNKSKIILDPTSTSAITVQSNASGSWSNVFYLDNSGNLQIKGTLTAGSVISDASISGGSLNIGNGKLVIDTSGNLTASNAKITGGSIAIGNNFTVDSSGNLVAKNGNFTGTINATNGTFQGTIYGSTINIGNGNFLVENTGIMTAKGATIQGLFKSSISGARIEISNNGIYGYNSAEQLHGIYSNPTSIADLIVYRQGKIIFDVRDDISEISLYAMTGVSSYDQVGSSGKCFLSSSGTTTKPYGTWNFNDATVTGVYARFK